MMSKWRIQPATATIKKWFTFIEMMIAIAVFSIGILVVLQMIIHNLTVVDTAKLKTTGTLIAQEGIELVYNLRDANLDKGIARNCLPNNELFQQTQATLGFDEDVCDSYFSSGWEDGQVLQVSYDPEQYIFRQWVDLSDVFLENFDTNELSTRTGLGHEFNLAAYRHITAEERNPSIDPSFYARYIVIKPVVEHGTQIDPNTLLKIESHVLMRKWGYTWEVVLESLMGNY